ncbi:MAG: hypothetical protein ACRCXL_01770 [Dermatophilaceae bacterium]
MDFTDVAVVGLVVVGLSATALGAPVMLARWAARSHALRAEQVTQHVLPGQQVLHVGLGRSRRPLPVTGAMVVLGVIGVTAAHQLGIAASAVVAAGVVAALLGTHRRVLVAATADEVVVIETTRDLDPVAVLDRIPWAEWQPTRRWGVVSHPVGGLDIVVVGAELAGPAMADAAGSHVETFEVRDTSLR